MAENENQGISRRDLLKRGAALGGAVVWATPVVQTLGMGRAFAQSASPTDVSYIALFWQQDCDPEGRWLYAKNEDNGSTGGAWDSQGGNLPGCSAPVSGASGVNGSTYFSGVNWSGGCVTIASGPSGPDCEVLYVAKGGQDCSGGTLTYGSAVCMPA